MPTKNLSPIKFISVKQGEGLHEDVGKEVGGPTFADANFALIRVCSRCEPEMLGCLKTDVLVTWENGESYKFTFDAKHERRFEVDLGKEIRQNLQFHTGEWRPSHFTEEKYRQYLSEEDPRIKHAAERLLNNCALEDKREARHGLDVH